MPNPLPPGERVRIDGKFFQAGTRRFFPKGVTYGPFAPDARGDSLGSPEQVGADFDPLHRLGANLLRVYHIPPRWFLDQAAQAGLRLLIDVPWLHHRCFLETAVVRAEIRSSIREAARACAAHPAVLALSVANEIAPDIARWHGAARVGAFLDSLIAEVKSVDAGLLCTFGNYPPTEFLQARAVDFVTFNVYLHEKINFENYLARLQMIADTKPLMLGEFGVDSLREGETRQAELLSWQIESAFRGGAAGVCLFSFTDEWFRHGRLVDDWAFGVTDQSRRPKPAFEAVRRQFDVGPQFAPPRVPFVSVVVASYQGARTLPACLESLERLNYPAYEIILVDDGSTDTTPEIAARHPAVRTVRFGQNEGLSAARNAGIDAARGEIVAFTDADCRADPDWLRYLVADLLNGPFVGIGGHNLPPLDDSPVAAAVMASPGGPAHVMLTDRMAEHIPGCNMAFYKWALEEVGGFDPIFRKAGDDVDLCWRLQERGYRLGFSAGGFVWHHRRASVRDYFSQQKGYGEAEALLLRRHPEYFNSFGASQWKGRIYSPSWIMLTLRRPIIYHGPFSSGFFQTLYAGPSSSGWFFLTSLEYHVLITLPLLVGGAIVRELLLLGGVSLAASLATCVWAASQANLPGQRRFFWQRPLVAGLFFLQPIVRGWARHWGGFFAVRAGAATFESLESLGLDDTGRGFGEVAYWNTVGVGRIPFLQVLLRALHDRQWPHKADPGWSEFDLEIYGHRCCLLQLRSVREVFGPGKEALRFRLQPRWTLFAKTLFWSLAALALVMLGVFGAFAPPWLWFLLPLPLVALVGWIRAGQRRMQRAVTALLNKLAGDQGMSPFAADSASNR